MSERADPPVPFDLPVASIDEYQLIVRGLECLKKELLSEAGRFAHQKMSRKAGSLEDVLEAGRLRLEQVNQANEIQDRWKALVAKHFP